MGGAREDFSLQPIGHIRSTLRALGDAPRQGSEGAPDAWLEVKPDLARALHGLAAGDEVIVITWLHRADRAVLEVHPRGDQAAPGRAQPVHRLRHQRRRRLEAGARVGRFVTDSLRWREAGERAGGGPDHRPAETRHLRQPDHHHADRTGLREVDSYIVRE